MPEIHNRNLVNGASPVQPQRDNETSREINNLADSVEKLQSVIADLSVKLAPITTSPPNELGGENLKSVTPSTPLAGAIHVQKNGVNSAINALQSLIARMEI